MSQTNNLPLKLGLLCGAALGTVVISIGIIRYKTGMILRGDQTLSLVYWVIFAVSISFVVFRFKKFDPLSFSFKRTIQIGLFAGLISGMMYTGYIVILNNFIDTELSSKVLQLSAQEHARENPDLTVEELADSLNVTKMSCALRGSIYTLVCMTFGILYSLLSTLVAKRLHWRIFTARDY